MKSSFLEFVYDFYESIKSHEIRLVYEGRVTQQVTKACIALTEAEMRENDVPASIQRRVYHVMVECLQNISRHADEYESGEAAYAGKGIFVVSRGQKDWCVTTGNAIHQEKVTDLREMMEQINELDEKELKELYVQKMRQVRLSSKGGAGLGFIDIRRKTKRQLDFHFLPITDTVSFFLLTIRIPGS